jgi:hypothetical protein
MPIDPNKLGGTGLSENEFRSKKLSCVRYTPTAKYAWDTGVAIGRYLAELKNGKLIGRKCKHCNKVLIPPRMFCEWCFKPTSKWVYLKDTGRVNTFSLCYIRWDMVKLEEPEIPAVIEIDGSDGGILHLLREVDPKKVKVGMRVKAVWKPENERTGAITDIQYFKPI